MQSQKKEGSGELQAENTTHRYLKSKGIARQYQYNDDNNNNDNKEDNIEEILAQFIDLETGACLECGVVHGFSNIDEARRRQENKKNQSRF
jgi:hypothetical protein